ncbi:MAG: 50S ribosomal protein L32 [Chloroflexi bacterium]|nr:50S ribosomal protein L32 [Chloroflexota bacterium]
MALPKRKHAKARTDKRRSHLHLEAPNLTVCPQCHTPRLAHRACPHCGYYKGLQVIAIGKVKEAR